jgi:hypothetical protein
MRETLLINLYYSCFLEQSFLFSINNNIIGAKRSLSTLTSRNTYVKMYDSQRQHAWINKFIHQRLNGEHPSSKAYFEQ